MLSRMASSRPVKIQGYHNHTAMPTASRLVQHELRAILALNAMGLDPEVSGWRAGRGLVKVVGVPLGQLQWIHRCHCRTAKQEKV